MDDYGSVCYLDVPKSGSSFVSKFLAENMSIPQKRFAKHGRITHNFNPEAFYFITCRDPLQQYLSLYSFGCGHQGGAFRRLKRTTFARHYDGTAAGFGAWLEMILDPRNAELLGESYSHIDTTLFGFQTFRFLVLSLQYPIRQLRTLRTRHELVRFYLEKNIAKRILRNETLREELKALAVDELSRYLVDLNSALAFIDKESRANSSERVDGKNEFLVSRELLQRVEEREWFMFDVLNYPRYTDPIQTGVSAQYDIPVGR